MAGKNKTIVTAEPGKQEMIITREFDAPRELVFQAFTDPELVPQWWGPRRLSTLVDKMDVRSGGLWRFINQDLDGNEYGFHGVYHEVCAPERIIDTFE
ncbi:MAG TPA: SRPBCC domain-containing protein, partial [Ktedonobacteraceae bacterium]